MKCAPPQASIATTQGRSWLKNAGTWLRRSLLRSDTRPEASAPCAWNTFFAQSGPTVVISGMAASQLGVLRSDPRTPIPSRGGHSIDINALRLDQIHRGYPQTRTPGAFDEIHGNR